MNQSDSILTQSPQALTQQLADWGIPSWRTKQIQEWIFHHRAVSFEACANLPKTLREKLIELAGVGPKVADCVLLFGFGRGDVFPVDTWQI